jgi:integral membrane sensor domain MASE1
MTIGILAVSSILFLTEPQYLPQTVFLAAALLILLTLCMFMPVETIFLIIVFCLAMTYSILFLLMVAVRTDPAFTGLLLSVVAIFWLVFVRPRAANEV